MIIDKINTKNELSTVDVQVVRVKGTWFEITLGNSNRSTFRAW